MSLSPGDRLDRYEVVALLGSGGMGEVYRARDPKLARDVALKILRIDAGLGTDGAPRLLREARAVAALSHANVLAVYDVGEVQEPASLRGLAYIAMELVLGEPLRAYLGDASVPIERRIGWLRDVAAALGAAHAAGIIHRDVKAENVMIRADGVVKVLDFGIARRAAARVEASSSTDGQSLPRADTRRAAPQPPALPTLTGQGTIVGTPFYMAPEQLRGEELDARADQFGWGVVAYWLLTGEPPWQGAEPLAILSQILSTDPRPPAELNPGIPPAISSAILRALEKRREARFPSMGALVAAMEAEVSTAPARPPPALPSGVETAAAQSSGDRRERDRGLAGSPRRWMGLGAALLAAGAAIALGWRARTAHREGTASSTTSSAAPAGECSSNAECVRAHGGGAWHCHRQRRVCVAVDSAECKAYAEPRDAESDDVVWLGGMFPLADPLAVSEPRAADLARQDFVASLATGVSAGSTSARPRPVALVVCDEAADPLRTARHLAEDVEVPAVIGFRSTAIARDTIANVLLPDHVLSFISISQAPSLTSIPEPEHEPRLVWRSTLNRDDSAMPLGPFISGVLEPAARAMAHGIGERPLRVAVVWPAAANHDYVEALFRSLRFNGRSALENGDDFRQFVYDAAADAGSTAGVVDALLGFAPNVIVYSGRPFYSSVLVPLEAGWVAARGPRPVYLTGSGVARDAANFAGRDPARRHRFFAVTNRSTTMTNAQLVLRYNAAFPAEPTQRTEAPQPSYDAFYTLAYAVHALGDAPVTGPALARAIERLLPPGQSIDVGAAQIPEAFAALRAGGRIDLNGAMGALDFDPQSGEAPIDYSFVCLGVDDYGRASGTMDSGLTYDGRTRKIVGALHCP